MTAQALFSKIVPENYCGEQRGPGSSVPSLFTRVESNALIKFYITGV